MSVVKTLEQAFCAAHGCTPYEARMKIFWASLHRRALLFAPLVWLFGGRYFYADIDLITRCAQTEGLARLEEEVRDYRFHPMNDGVLRKAGVRVSARRLLKLAQKYLHE